MADRQVEAEARGEPYVVLDVPLLFESRGAADLDDVILVYAPEKLALRRLIEQHGMPEEQTRTKIAAQMPIEEKRRLARHVIENTGTLKELRARTDRVWAEVIGSDG